MTKRLLAGLLIAGSASSAIAAQLPELYVADRGELLLDESGEVYYEPWRLQSLAAPAHVGLLMLLPGRLSTRKQIEPLENALRKADFDHTLVSSTSLINMDDATWGAGVFIEGQLAKEKASEPLVHLVVDEQGKARRSLGLAEGDIHVLVYSCQGQITQQHQGKLSSQQVDAVINELSQSLARTACPAVDTNSEP